MAEAEMAEADVAEAETETEKYHEITPCGSYLLTIFRVLSTTKRSSVTS